MKIHVKNCDRSPRPRWRRWQLPNTGALGLRALLIVVLVLFALPGLAQEKKPRPERSRLVFAFSRPELGCILVDPPRHAGGVAQWDCPPKGEAVVSVKKARKQ
ncbi:MAG TPA: hypothetical protein VE778_06175 [Candidatus Bathyarchaeia archaeon]|nr:hypothetical protein [Candidatus Bathyarchaeia archaeon]